MGGRGTDGSRGNMESIFMAEQINMMEHYVSGEGFSMNDYLRGMPVNDVEYSEEQIVDFVERFTKVMDAQSLPSEMQVYRGATIHTLVENTGLSPNKIFGNPSVLEGKTITERAFMSTTHDFQMAKEYADRNFGVVYSIQLPKGAKAVHQNRFVRYLDGDEVTVQRNSQTKIDRAYVKDGILFVEAHYTGVKKK